MKKFCLSIIFCFICICATGYKSTHPVKKLRVEDGLSNDYVVSVDIGKDGTVWIGTEDGMNSFDGIELKSYTKHSGSLSGNALNDILFDSFADDLWIATQRNGLCRFSLKNESLSNVFLPDTSDVNSIISNEITHIEQDDEGNIWISTYSRGMEKYDRTTGSFIHYNHETVEGMPDSPIIGFTLGHDGRIYIGHYWSGLTILDPVNMKAYNHKIDQTKSNSIPSNNIGCVIKDHNNNIWIGTRRGLALYRPVTNDFQVYNYENSGLPEDYIYSIMVTRDRRIFVSPTFNGVWYADIDSLHDNPKFKPFPEAESIKNLPIRGMCEDLFGNLWIGSYGRGLIFVGEGKNQGFTVSSSSNDEFAKNVTAIEGLSNGNHIIGTHGGGIDILDSQFNRIASGNSILTDKTILSLYQDSSENVWIGVFNGRLLCTDKSFSKKTEVSSVWETRCIIEWQDMIWAGTTSGLYTIDKKKKTIVKTYSDRDKTFPENFIRSFCIDPFGRLWVGTFGSGIVILDKNLEIAEIIKTDEASLSNQINDLHVDEKGNIYAATGEGLRIFNFTDSKIWDGRIVGMNDGISSDMIKSVLSTENGDIWFTTNLSICRIDYKSGKIVEYRNHSGSGEPIGNFNGNSGHYCSNGSICFGSTEGIVRFNPEDLMTPIEPPTAHFKKMYVFKKGESSYSDINLSCGFKDRIRLSYRERTFNISFSVDNYSLSHIAEYKITLDSNEFYPSQGNTMITLHDMSSGRHKISVAAKMFNDGELGPEDNLDIYIGYPLLLTPFMKIIYIIATVFAILYGLKIYKFRIERKNKKKYVKEAMAKKREIEDEKLRFYTNITHELRTPLTLILGPMEDIKNNPELPQSIQSKITVLDRNVHRLYDLVNRLLEFRKVETSKFQFNPIRGDISAKVESIARVFRDSNTNKNIRVVYNVTQGINGIFDPELLNIVLNNILSNSFKFTQSGIISLIMHPIDDGKKVQLNISDTGCGIPEEELPKIFDRYYQIKGSDNLSQGTGIGLSLVKNLLNMCSGSIEVESEVGKGSVFKIIMPLKQEIENIENEKAESKETKKEESPTIVIAEDNEDIRDYLEEQLQKYYTIYSASNGSDALELILKHSPDLIVTDIMMPVIDGLTLCRKVKNDIRISHIPIILLTAKDSFSDRNEGYKSGADSYLTKPFTGEIILSRIKNLLDSRSALARQYSSSIGMMNDMNKIEEISFNEIDNAFLKKIRAVIEENMSSETLDVNFLADNMNMSKSTLYRKMKKLTDISTNEYIRKLRLHKAAELLSSGECNVSEASYKVGISNIIYFRQCFKEEFGVAPSEYRKSLKK